MLTALLAFPSLSNKVLLTAKLPLSPSTFRFPTPDSTGFWVFGIMMSNAESLHGYDFDPRRNQFEYAARASWPMQASNMIPSHAADMAIHYQRSTTPVPLQTNAQSFQQTVNYQNDPNLMRDWHQMTSHSLSAPSYALDTSAYAQPIYDTYGMPLQTSPTDYIPSAGNLNAGMETNLDGSGLQMDGSYLGLPNQMNHIGDISYNWQDFSSGLMGFSTTHGLADLNSSHQAFSANSPTDTYLEVRSLTSSSSENGWVGIDYVPTHVGPTIFNAEQALHPRTSSNSSSDAEKQSRRSWGSYVEVPNAINSPGTDSAGDFDFPHEHSHHYDQQRQSPPAVITTALVQPIAIKKPTSPQRSSASTSPVARRQSRKNSIMKPPKAIARRPSQTNKNDSEKRIGRRRGPLKPDQRKQASEIRKLGACLRCRFLKKTVSVPYS